MEDRALGGVKWTLATYVVNKVITFATTIVLARLLTPEDFGLVALAVLVIGIVGVFGDLGFGAAQVIRQDLSRSDQRTVFTVTLGSAMVVAVVVAAGAPLAALAFDEPRLTVVLAVLAVNTLPTGVGWFFETVLQRELEFARRFVAATAQALTWACVGIGSAVAGAGVWSLVAAQIASTLVYALVLMRVSPYRVGPGFDRTLARDLFATGRGFLAQGGASFLAQNADFLAVGQVRGAADLGVYSVAYRLGDLPHKAIADPVAKVSFPAWARMRSRGEDLASAYTGVVRLLALATFPIGMVLSATAEPFVLLVYGDRWRPMIDVLVVLGLWAACRPGESLAGWLLNAAGQAGAVGRVLSLSLLWLVPALFAAAQLGGIATVAGVMLAQAVVMWVLLARLIARRVGVGVRAQWRAVQAPLIALVPGWAVTRLVSDGLGGQAGVMRVIAAAVAGVAVFAVAGTLAERRLLPDAARQVARLIRSAPAASHATLG